MSEKRFGADTTFSGMTSELLKLFGEKAVPLKQHAGMFLSALALPKAEDATHDDSFDYKLKLLIYDTNRSERAVRIFGRAQKEGYFTSVNSIEVLDRNYSVRKTFTLGTTVVAEEVCMPDLREFANDALHFEQVVQLESYLSKSSVA